MKTKIKKTSKYNSVITTVDGKKFRSKKEAKDYTIIRNLWTEKKIKLFLCQVPLFLALKSKFKYFCDFLIIHNDNTLEFRDTKGVKTPMYKLKKQLVESHYNIKINDDKNPYCLRLGHD